MVRIAAVADVHCRMEDAGRWRRLYAGLRDEADLLIIAGDLTGRGLLAEVDLLISELADVGVPIIVVLGNHDYHERKQAQMSARLHDAGICVLDGGTAQYVFDGCRVGLTGAKGFAGGFEPTLLSAFGEPEMIAWVNLVKAEQAKIERGLAELVAAQPPCDLRIVVLHYAPIRATLAGEPPELYPVLGCSRLLLPIEKYGADLVLHGHAHFGSAVGQTPSGIPVHNVALPVIKRPYKLFTLGQRVE